MKFGAVAPQGGASAPRRCTRIRQGALVLKKGTLIGPVEAAALEAAGHQGHRGGAARTGRRVRGRGGGRDRRGDCRRGRACRPRLYRPRQSVRAERRACWSSTRMAIDRLNRVDEAITVATLAGLQAGRRRRDDRHREDHSVRGRRRPRATRRWRRRRSRWCASRPTASARSASSRPCCPGSRPR